MSDISFEALPLAAPIQRALRDKGYTTPSPIQAQAIPLLLEGRDLLGCAQTGTGKTAAFALPILQKLYDKPQALRTKSPRALVLTPTRELAVQIADNFDLYGKYMKVRHCLVYGGVSQVPQVRALREGVDILVATPGRLLDLYKQGHVSLDRVEFFVLDEVDRMLDMGFIHDVRFIARALPEDRQSLFFSATVAGGIAEMARGILHNPAQVSVAPQSPTADKVDHRICFVDKADKQDLLTELLRRQKEQEGRNLTLVFSRTKHGANKIAKQLLKAGIRADAIHGNKSQSARQRALDDFRDGRIPVLVATDVAARGIDVKGITLVVNYDLPKEPESYIHRIGRTARAGAEGRALSFCTLDEFTELRDIERLLRQEVPCYRDHEFHAAALAERYAQFRSGGRPPASGGGRSAPAGKRSFTSGARRTSVAATSAGNNTPGQPLRRRRNANRCVAR